MELTIALAISIISVVITVINFAFGRKEKAIQSVKENHQELIEYQVREIKEAIVQINQKLDKFNNDIENTIQKEMELHIKLYHGGELK